MGLGHSPRIVTDGLLVCLDPLTKKVMAAVALRGLN